MLTAFRWSLRLVLLLCLLGLAALAGAYHFASRSLPPHEGSFAVEGITQPVEIIRDSNAIPHILGSTDADSFFGLGFVHAQDRLWQMTMLRRTVQGRLSELFGARTLKIDEAMRRLDLYGLAQASVAVQDPQSLAALEAYSAGVNAWLAEINNGARGRGAPEFFLFGADIAPWQPADSIALIKLMGVQLATQIDDEIDRARAAMVLDPERLKDLMPEAPGPGAAALRKAGLWPRQHWAGGASWLPTRQAENLSPFPERGLASASNVWAASSDRAARGSSLLANDPHLELTAPAIWYLARIELQSGGVIGGSIPGMPVILVGRNAELAWGLTSAYADDIDLYIERLVPDQPGFYETPNGPAPFRTDRVIIGVKDAPPETITLEWTENGPVMPPDLFNLGSITPPGHVTSLAWTLLSDEDSSMSAALKLMHAQSIEAGLASARTYVAPAQNLLLATESDIAMTVAGALPRRAARHDTRGQMPSRGWLTRNRWQGDLEPAASPVFRAEQSGIIGNTNNKSVDRPFPFHISYDWGDTQRIQRLGGLMAGREVHTRESFVEAQLDTVSTPARTLLPLIASELWFREKSAPSGTQARQKQEALDLLAEWNGEMNEHLPQPLIYEAWLRALNMRLIEDDLGSGLARAFARPDPLFLERVFRDIDGASAWCDVRQSATTESCAEMAQLALDDAIVWLSETYGRNISALRWGDAHQATHDHPVLGDIPVLSWVVNIRQSTSGGDHTLMRGATPANGSDPFLNTHGAAYRGVYDFADPDSSLFVISTGQSGHPLSRFYDNLSRLWRQGEYVTMSLDPSLARAASVGVTFLTPANE